MNIDYKKVLPHALSIIIIIVLNVIYFLPQFQGKVINSHDVNSHVGMAKEARDYRANTGEEVLWTNSMFGGMPTFNISTKPKNNITRTFKSALGGFIPHPAGTFIMGMVAFFICMVLLGANAWVSLVMSIMFGLGTSNLMLLGAGHNTKIMSILSAPPIVAGAIMAFRGRLWIGAFMFTLFLGISIGSNHPQMVYYLAIPMVLYVIIELVNAIKEKTIASFAKTSAMLGICALVALGASATKLLPTYEFGKQTMRGKPILETPKSGNASSSSEINGLQWDYAMGWSAGFLDLVSVYMPYAAGGGSGEELSKSSNLGKATGQRRDFVAPTYFGSLPSTAGPYYFGAILFFLFVLGMFIIKGVERWWLLAAVLLTMMMAMGKNLEGFNRFLFDNLPLLNKFRTPNSILSITGIFLAIGAGLSLHRLSSEENREDLIKPFYYAFGGVAIFTLLFGLVGPSMVSFEAASDARLGDASLINALHKDRAAMLSSSAWRSLGFIVVAGAVIWAYLKSKIPMLAMVLIVGVFSVGELIGISKNYFGDNFVSKRQQMSSVFAPRPADKQILADKDPHFRVQDFSVDTYNSASTSYFHKTVGGYSPVKLQRFEDIKVNHLLNRSNEKPFGNQQVLNMLNAKYFIVPTSQTEQAAQRNPDALGNAWFVNTVQSVASANQEISALANFDPAQTAIVHAEFNDYVAGLNLNKNGSIKLSSYTPNKITYQSSSSSDQLAVFSEIWYGPDLGWDASIDGQPVSHIRANYLLRALKVPSGNHEIVFEFKPKTYATGNMISLISSILIVLLGAFSSFKYFKSE